MDGGGWPGIEYAPGKVIVGRSPAMQRVFYLLNQYAPSSAPVLITGETGTGKELVARAIHYHSGRTGRFVAVNCASVSDSLFESEFFGHRRGAFTGALADRAGWFELANNGTLLLDEVGDMPLNQQAKLLRAIEDGAVTPVGASSPVAVDVRIVAATNVELHEAVAKNRFRRDFLDRLGVLTLRLPPLLERQEDIPLLVGHFLAAANEEEGTDVQPPAKADVQSVARACAGKSIRVLKNALRRLVVVKRHGPVRRQDLVDAGLLPATAPVSCHAEAAPKASGGFRVELEAEPGVTFRQIMATVGKAVTEAALAKHGGRVAEARCSLGMSKCAWYGVRRKQGNGRAAAPGTAVYPARASHTTSPDGTLALHQRFSTSRTFAAEPRAGRYFISRKSSRSSGCPRYGVMGRWFP